MGWTSLWRYLSLLGESRMSKVWLLDGWSQVRKKHTVGTNCGCWISDIRTGTWWLWQWCSLFHFENLTVYFKKTQHINWFFTSQYCCPKGHEIYLNFVRCFASAERCGHALGRFFFKPLEFMFSKLFLYQWGLEILIFLNGIWVLR